MANSRKFQDDSWPIPVGKLEWAKPKRVRSIVRSPRQSQPEAGIRWKLIASVGGVVWLVVLGGVGILFAVQRNSPAPVVSSTADTTETQKAERVVAKRAAISAPIRDELPMPREAIAPQSVVPELLAALPREIIEGPEHVAIEPREFVAKLEEPKAEEPVEAVPEVAVAAEALLEKATAAIVEQNVVAAVPPPAAAECGRFGTTINFLSTPTIANEKARQATDKLVMILQVAGNFEEPGFT
jgi:hypothetical protein